MVLDYIALAILIFVVGIVVYGVVVVYGIPYEIAKARNHPHREAIGAATWVSLFTLGVLWPFLWIWALICQPGRGWGFFTCEDVSADQMAELQQRIMILERKCASRTES